MSDDQEMRFSTSPQDMANAKIVQRLVSEDEWRALRDVADAAQVFITAAEFPTRSVIYKQGSYMLLRQALDALKLAADQESEK